MEADYKTQTSSRDYLRIFFRRKTVIIIPVIIAIFIAFLKVELAVNQYQTTVKLMVSGGKELETDIYKKYTSDYFILKNNVQLVKSRSVLERVVKVLRLDQRPLDEELRSAGWLKEIIIKHNVKEIKEALEEMSSEERRDYLFNNAIERLEQAISVSDLKDTYILHISVTDINPSAAVEIANAVSRSFVILDLEQQIAELKLKYGEKHSTVKQLQDFVDHMKENLSGKVISDIEAFGPASIKIIEQAKTAGLVEGLNRGQTLIIGFLLGIFLGCMFAVIIDYLDQTFKSPIDVETFLNIPVLCSIPKNKPRAKLLMNSNNTTNYSRSFQVLSEQIQMMIKDKGLKSILVTGVESSQDIATIIANLGFCLAHNGANRVLIIDANFRQPSVSNIFNGSGSPNIVDLLENKIRFEDAIVDLGSNLFVLPTIKPLINPIVLLDSQGMTSLLKIAREQFDCVLIACSNLGNFTDPVIISVLVDGVVLVINEGITHRQVTKRVIAPMEQKNVNIIGVILDDRTYVIPKVIYKVT